MGLRPIKIFKTIKAVAPFEASSSVTLDSGAIVQDGEVYATSSNIYASEVYVSTSTGIGNKFDESGPVITAGTASVSGALDTVLNYIKNLNFLQTSQYFAVRAASIADIYAGFDGSFNFYFSGSNLPQDTFVQVDDQIYANSISGLTASNRDALLLKLGYTKYDVAIQNSAIETWNNVVVPVTVDAITSSGISNYWYPKYTIDVPALSTNEASTIRLRLTVVNEQRPDVIVSEPATPEPTILNFTLGNTTIQIGDTIYDIKGLINLESTTLSGSTIKGTTLSGSVLNSINANINNLTSSNTSGTNATFNTLTGSNFITTLLSGTSGNILFLTSSNISSSFLTASGADISALTSSQISSSKVNISTLTSSYVSSSQIITNNFTASLGINSGGPISINGNYVSPINTTISNIYVAKSGSDTNNGTSISEPLLTIQAAIDKISEVNNTATQKDKFHVTLHIASGSYDERISILNKSYGGKTSDLLLAIVGEREYIYQNIPITNKFFTDQDTGKESTSNFSIPNLILDFNGSPPEQDSLKGCFLLAGDRTTAVINSHSGNYFYLNSWDMYYDPKYPETSTDFINPVSIFRPAVEVNGYFRCIGNNGIIQFNNIRLNSVGTGSGEDWSDSFSFSSFGNDYYGPINPSYNGVDPYSSLGYDSYFDPSYLTLMPDSIIAYNCQIIRNKGYYFYVGPKTHFQNCYLYADPADGMGIASLYDGTDSFYFNGSFSENVTFYFSGVNNVDFSRSYLFSATRYCNVYLISCPTFVGPRKLKTTSIENNFTIRNSKGVFYPDSTIISQYISLTDSSLLIRGPSFFNGFTRAFYLIRSNLELGGDVNSIHYFSGSVQADRFAQIRENSQFSSTAKMDIRDVKYNPSNNEILFWVMNSYYYIPYNLPLTSSNNYPPGKSYDVVLDNSAYYKYTDFSIVNQQNSRLEYSNSPQVQRAIYDSPTIINTLSVANSFSVTTGSNKPSDLVTLNGGSPSTVTVNNSLANVNSIIILTKQTTNYTGSVSISSKTSGQFTIKSSENGDTDSVGYLILKTS